MNLHKVSSGPRLQWAYFTLALLLIDLAFVYVQMSQVELFLK